MITFRSLEGLGSIKKEASVRRFQIRDETLSEEINKTKLNSNIFKTIVDRETSVEILTAINNLAADLTQNKQDK